MYSGQALSSSLRLNILLQIFKKEIWYVCWGRVRWVVVVGEEPNPLLKIPIHGNSTQIYTSATRTKTPLISFYIFIPALCATVPSLDTSCLQEAQLGYSYGDPMCGPLGQDRARFLFLDHSWEILCK